MSMPSCNSSLVRLAASSGIISQAVFFLARDRLSSPVKERDTFQSLASPSRNLIKSDNAAESSESDFFNSFSESLESFSKWIFSKALITLASPSKASKPLISLNPLFPLIWAFAFCNAIFTDALVILVSKMDRAFAKLFELEGSIHAAFKSKVASASSMISDCGKAANCAKIGVASAIFVQTGCTPFEDAVARKSSMISSQDSSQSSENKVLRIKRTDNRKDTGVPSSIKTSFASGNHSMGPLAPREVLRPRGDLRLRIIERDGDDSSSSPGT